MTGSRYGNRLDFPEGLCPTTFRYTPGTLPETVFESQNGAVSFVQYGRTFVNAKLEMDFVNITDSEAALILDNYQQMKEDVHIVFDYTGMFDPNLTTQIENGLMELRWRYDGPPQMTHVFPGVKTVSTKFIAYFYGA